MRNNVVARDCLVTSLEVVQKTLSVGQQIDVGFLITVNRNTIEITDSGAVSGLGPYFTVFFSYEEFLVFVRRIKSNGRRWFKTERDDVYVLKGLNKSIYFDEKVCELFLR